MEDIPLISGILFAILFSLTTLIYFIISLLEYSFFQVPSNYSDNNQKPKNVIEFYIKNFIEQPESPLFTWFIFRILIIISQTILLWLFLINYFTFFNLIIILLLAFLIVIFIDYIFAEWISFFIIKYVDTQKIIKYFLWIFIPFIAINKYLINIFPILKKVFSHRFAKKEEVTIDELTEAIQISINNESINTPTTSVLLRGVINLSEIEVKEIMKPRVDVVAIPIESSFKEIIDLIVEYEYSRYPVYEKDIDNIKGVLYIKDLLPYMTNAKEDFYWQNHIRSPFFIPENMLASNLLKEFQKNRIHIAIVVDEYGGTSGIVTLEDLLEEIVGEIQDEHDNDADEIFTKKIDDNTYLVDARISLNDFIKLIHCDEDYFEEFEDQIETVAGVILTLLGKFPQKNEEVIYKNCKFKILSIDERRIKVVRVELLPTKQDDND
ncbi:MAG TPA: transporter associated domain-containing protein [Bacteroidales bacterium]|nr:transporter associated domain-containing protein [Bacteroidales bacterium]